MTPEQLRTLAGCAFGPAWRLPLARELGVCVRTVERWGQGRRVIPDDTARLIAGVCVAIARRNRRAAIGLYRKLLRQQVKARARARTRPVERWRPLRAAGTARPGSN